MRQPHIMWLFARRVVGVATTAILASSGTARAQTALTVLHQFDGRSDFGVPATSITEAVDGNFFVTTARGGSHNRGAILRVTPSGVATVVHSFSGGADGATPLGALIEASDGYFYGTTEGGGVGFGTVFKITSNGGLVTLHSFTGLGSGAYPRAALIQANDGLFYGTTAQGGAMDHGTVFAMTAEGAVTFLHSFADLDGAYPEAALIQTTDGLLRGTTTRRGGDYVVSGTAFVLSPSGDVTTFASFGFGPEGGVNGPLLQSGDGTLYVTTVSGPSANVFRFLLYLGRYSPLAPPMVSFRPTTTGPIAALIQGIDGNLYGMTSRDGPSGHGRVFKIDAAQQVSTVYAFSDGTPDSLIQGADGSFYGTTSGDASNPVGTVFKMTADGTVEVLCTFPDIPTSVSPTFGLTQAADGNFNGTASGGRFGKGTAYRMSPQGDINHLYSFRGGATDGASPSSSLIQGRDGHLYGSTSAGGVSDSGTIFRLTTSGEVTILYAFTGSFDGAKPFSLSQGPDGDIYGLTRTGGAHNGGTAFRINVVDRSFTVLHAFGGVGDVSYPATLLRASDGNLYGSARNICSGSIFRMTPEGAVTTIYTVNLSDGDYSCLPLPGIIQGSDGNLYGTTFGSGKGARGTFYRITLQGQVTVVRQYNPAQTPNVALLIQGSDGNFYGGGFGPSGGSAISKITPEGVVTVLHAFDYQTEGSGLGGLLQAMDGNFYGTTSWGGPFLGGGAFRLNAIPPAPAKVNATIVGGLVRLTWSGVPTATSYTIRRVDQTGAGVVLASGVSAATFVDGTATVGQRYRYVVSAKNVFGESVSSDEVSITAGRAPAGDFDGDGRTDAATFRPSTNLSYVRSSATGSGLYFNWGLSGDITVPGDYDGDGVADIAVFRPSTGIWYVLNSSTRTGAFFAWGLSDDVPVPADYDGDARTDIAVFRPSTGIWYVRYAGTGMGAYYNWGLSGDVPVPGDYDGDGQSDVAVFRPSTGIWYLLYSTTRTGAFFNWGVSGDVTVPADYDGDGRTDVAVYRPSTGIWYVLYARTRTGGFFNWGVAGDVPVPGDYDGDGQADVAVFRPSMGIWYVWQSSTRTGGFLNWGLDSDIPILKRP